MKIEFVLNKCQNNEPIDINEYQLLMLHAIDLLKHLNKLTQDRIDEFMAHQLPLAA